MAYVNCQQHMKAFSENGVMPLEFSGYLSHFRKDFHLLLAVTNMTRSPHLPHGHIPPQ